MRSVQEVYIDDRPMTDDRPLICENFKWPYLCDGSSDPLHVWFCGVLRVSGSKGTISGFANSSHDLRAYIHIQVEYLQSTQNKTGANHVRKRSYDRQELVTCNGNTAVQISSCNLPCIIKYSTTETFLSIFCKKNIQMHKPSTPRFKPYKLQI